eukprot:UN08774
MPVNIGRQRNSTLFLIEQFENSGDQFDEDTLEEINSDPVVWLLSMECQDRLSTPAEVAGLLRDLERAISLIEKYIPRTDQIFLSEEENKTYMTAVIQELLKRAQNAGLLKGIQQNWGDWAGVDLDSNR